MLGLPDGVTTCLFDLDGVLTNTAAVHDKAWTATFDEFLRARDGDGLPAGDVRRATDDRRRAVGARVAEVDLTDAQAVGVGVLLGAEHLADDEVLDARHTVMVDRLDLRPGHRQAPLDRVHVEV